MASLLIFKVRFANSSQYQELCTGINAWQEVQFFLSLQFPNGKECTWLKSLYHATIKDGRTLSGKHLAINYKYMNCEECKEPQEVVQKTQTGSVEITVLEVFLRTSPTKPHHAIRQ